MSIPVFDLHCDTADRLGWQTIDRELKTVSGDEFFTPDDAESPERYFSLKDNDCAISIDMAKGTPWAQCFATFVPDSFSPEQSLRFQAQIMAHISAQTNLNHAEATEAHTAGDIRPALEQNRFVCIHTIENARMFAQDLGLIEALKRAGVLMASLSWNAPGPLASGHDTHAGLTDLGRQAVTEMERCGMVLDVSHLNDECFDEVAALAKRPFVASHSNSRAVCSHVRNLTDDQFKVIRDAGGVVGLNFCNGFLVDGANAETSEELVTFDAMARHIEHWLELGGEDVIALGGDLDGADVPAYVENASKFPAFQQMLIERFGGTITRKFCFENALSFFERF